MRGEPDGCGFAIGASDRNDRNPAVVPIGEHVVNDGLADIAALAKGGADVHAQTGCRIDFNDAAILFFERFENRFANHIDTANVDTHHLRCSHNAFSHFGVNIVGDIGGRTAR